MTTATWSTKGISLPSWHWLSATSPGVVQQAGMTLADLAQLTIYATDVDATLAVYDTVVERLRAANAAPPATLVGVTRLALPGMAVELHAMAIA